MFDICLKMTHFSFMISTCLIFNFSCTISFAILYIKFLKEHLEIAVSLLSQIRDLKLVNCTCGKDGGKQEDTDTLPSTSFQDH